MEYVDGGGRNLRAKARKVYDDSKIDDEIEGRRTFDVEEKLHDPKFNQTLSEILVELEGKDFDLKFVQENGFNNPILFKSKEGLGLSVPDAECFSVIDVKSYVGARRVLDVFDCDTHDAEQMTMQRWVQYYTSDERTKIKNVTSLEFSHTGLDRLVDCPKVIRDDLDMVWQMWPKHLIAQQKDSTNTIVNMKYPKIRKYCLMSVAGCYTDWHIDFGGTSVWYHILKGSKVFWLSPPEEENLKQYEKWVLSGRQQTVFLGDLLKQCYRVHLVAGDTFLIPTGWLHAVYTPDDSLVFGGNFIHQYNIPMQLRVYEIEENTKVPQRLRFPFYAEMHWYLVKTYVDLLERDQDEKRMKVFEEDIGEGVFKVVKEELSDHEDLASKAERAKCGWDPVYLTHFEVEGFKHLVEYMRRWTYGKEHVPKDLGEDGMALLERLEELIEYHEDDDQILASSGVNPVMQFQQASLDSSTTANYAYKNGDHVSDEAGDIVTSSVRKNHVWDGEGLGGEWDFKSSYRTVRTNGAVPGRKANFRLAAVKRAVGASKEAQAKRKTSSCKSAIRRVRCHNCEGCQESNCNKCRFCLDMPKNGGEGKLRQSCALRYCRNPQFPSSVGCAICRQNLQNCPDPLMECSICQEIVHPKCLKVSKPCKISKKINNCWECPKCCSPHDDETTEFSEDKVGGVVSQFRYRFNSEIRRALGKTGSDTNKRKRRLHREDDFAQNGKAIRRSKSMENGNGLEEALPSEDSGNDDYDGDDDEPLISQTAPDKIGKHGFSHRKSSKRTVSLHGGKLTAGHSSFVHRSPRAPKPVVRTEPLLVVRPRVHMALPEMCVLESGHNHALTRPLWLHVFTFLSKADLCTCMRVCKSWNCWCMDSNFWLEVDASDKHLELNVLQGIVRRQPEILRLASTNVTGKQMGWLLARLPRLRGLDISLNTVSAVSALCRGTCPPLRFLDLSWCGSIYDKFMTQHLITTRISTVLAENRSRLHFIEDFRIAGCDISDDTVNHIWNHLPNLTSLDVSYCTRLTNSCVDALRMEDCPCRRRLRAINFTGCLHLTDCGLESVRRISSDLVVHTDVNSFIER